MAWAFLKVVDDGDARVEDGEILLGEPDKAEAESLPLHTDKCARRYRVTILRLNRLDRSMRGQTLLLWLVLGTMAASNYDKGVAFLKAMFGP